MQAIRFFATCGIAILIADLAHAQSAADIFREMDERKRASYSGVQNYTQKKQTLGLCSLEYYEKETTQSTDGRGTISYMRLVPISEIAERNADHPSMANMSPEELDAIAGQLRMYGPQMETAMRNEMQEANLPGGIGQMLMNPPPDEPWLSANPNDMLGMYATMLEGAAAGKRQNAAQAAEAEQQAATSPLAEMASRTRVMGREIVRNRQAILLLAENLNHTQITNGQEFTLNTMRLWVAADDYVPLKMSMEGFAREGGESRELKIEREDMEYRPVPGCPGLQEPFRTVMRIGGVLNAAEQAQMAEAQAQMADMERQLASLPPAQKEMIMRQMGPQLDMMRNMSANGGIEVISEVVAMRCNTGVPSNGEYAATLPGNMMGDCGATGLQGSAAGSGPSPAPANQRPAATDREPPAANAPGTPERTSWEVETELLRMIQRDLQTLGYDPGNTDGILTRQTVIAITRFQADNGLEVTGRATPQLAGILQARVAAS